jgi:histone deacetylase 1/2
VFEKFHEFQQLVERKFDRKIIAMQTDWGGEYEKLNSFFQKVGISHIVSCLHTHQKIGAVERKHRHIVEVVLSLLAHSSMPLKYWDQAFLAAAYLINCLPAKNLHSPLLSNFFFMSNLTIPCFVYSGVHVGQTFVHIIHASLLSSQSGVPFRV